MIELIIVACLVSAPETCAEHRLSLTLGGMHPGQCLYASPPQIARWQEAHRNWRVASWKCAVVLPDRHA